MKAFRSLGALAAAAVLAIASGCGTLSTLEGKKIDYKSSSTAKLPPLDVPPDLTVPAADERYTVPDTSAAPANATYSAYSKDRAAQPQTPAASGVLPQLDKAQVQRAGGQRWLVVRATPEQVWPVVKEFWQENGFIVNTEQPQAGLMETDWAENRAKIPQDGLRNLLGKVIDNLYSTAERDKFRTRLERGAESGTTEIYISHRGMYEVLEGGDGGKRTIWQPRPADADLEAEMLRRLMVRFGVDEARAQSAVAERAQDRAKLAKASDGAATLSVEDPFDRAWRRVGLALDRVGFTVEDRDRSKGIYFVRYVPNEADAKKGEKDKSLLSKLAFWKSDEKNVKPEQFRIRVAESGAGSEVQVFTKDGGADKSDAANRILGLLYEQLK